MICQAALRGDQAPSRVCFTLSIRTQFRHAGFAAVGLSVEDADSYPTLTGEFSAQHPPDLLEGAGLRAGDQLVRAGEADLRGVGTVRFFSLASEQAGHSLVLPLVAERDGRRRATSLELAPTSGWRPLLAASFTFTVAALFLLLRGRPTPSVRFLSYCSMCFALVFCFMNGSHWEFQAHRAIFLVFGSAGIPLLGVGA